MNICAGLDGQLIPCLRKYSSHITVTVMTIDQRNQIVKLCKQHIDEQGSVRVGWAAEKILGQKPQHNVLDKVAAILLQDGQYLKEQANPNFKYDWNVRRNPEHKKERWTERNPIGFEIIKGFITAVFSVIVSVFLTLKIIDNKKEDKADTQKNITSHPSANKKLTDTLRIDSTGLNRK